MPHILWRAVAGAYELRFTNRAREQPGRWQFAPSPPQSAGDEPTLPGHTETDLPGTADSAVHGTCEPVQTLARGPGWQSEGRGGRGRERGNLRGHQD